MGDALGRAFLEGSGVEAGGAEAAEGAGALEPAALEAIAAARAACPAVAIALEPFARSLGERCRGPQPLEALRALKVGDLLVAWAALEGDRGAIQALDEVLGRATAGTVRLGGSAAFADEVRQLLRERLLVADERGHRRLSDYAGTGPLESWCRVAATRIAIRMQEGSRREITLDPDLVGAGPAATGVETAALRGEHAAAVSEAFSAAVRGLGAEERVLLRYHFVDGLSFEQIAELFGTHRTTISRRLASVRRRVLEATREGIRERLGADSAEVSSLLRAAQDHLDVDLSAWLRTHD